MSNRRQIIQAASTLMLPWSALPAQAKLGERGVLIPRGAAEPVNLEMPFSTLREFITPNDRFYVRNHFPQPKVEARDWRLRVEGLVREPLDLTYDDLRKMRTRTQAALLECAGNGRSFLDPKTTGVQWEQGAVGTAEWTGVPLGEILKRAGVRSGAVDVVMEGMDEGEPANGPGRIRFARSVPLGKAREDVLIAYQMNGQELPPSHGFPARAIVPGWYGVSSVKWINRIRIIDAPFRGFFQSVDYTFWERSLGTPNQIPITTLQLKSQIARPTASERVPAGLPYRVLGAAWTGDGEVVRVEVSADGGATWEPARLLGDAVPGAWRLWDYAWRVPAQAGKRTLMSRAIDNRGRVQDRERNRDRRNYLITHTLPIEVQVG